ncbi:hypothetical protein FQN50_001192 [Emmonsiellopsis sp. PD_5]|nr:hypothetical protein FQN50_001192 [Emmonsiellopsis sp. PD_5]
MASQPPADISRATSKPFDVSETAIQSTQIAQATTEPSAPNTSTIPAPPPHANPTTPTASIPSTQTTHSPPVPQPNPLPSQSIPDARKPSNPPLIPPPPKAGQLPPATTSTSTSPPQTTTTLPSSQTNPSPYNPPPPAPIPPQPSTQPLDHPPGYIQNPAANAPLGAFHNHLYPDDVSGRGGYHLYPGRDPNANADINASGVSTGMSTSGGPGSYYPSPTTTTADGYPQPTADGGRWRWDAAPGGAGGRYEYVYDGGRAGEDEDGEGDDWWEGAEGIWNATVEFARGVGEGVARAEEGVWRWINGR